MVIGSFLKDVRALEDIAKRFEETDGNLVFRLLKALRAGSESGGDKRGQRSAAKTLVNKNDFFLKLRVDEGPNPIQELANAVEKHLYTAKIERRTSKRRGGLIV